MKKITHKLLNILIVSLLITACNENNSSNKKITNNQPKIESDSTNYLYGNNGDTVRLFLQYTAQEIVGSLSILPYEKDSRIGTIVNGQMFGDTLFANFLSMQEGQESDCEIAFLKNGDQFILTNDIYTDYNYEYNDDYTKGKFKNKLKIKFDGEVLNKTISNK